MKRSNGLAWAVSMLGLDVVEFLVFVHAFHYDHVSATNPAIRLYFVLLTASLVLQVAGVLLVKWGVYRTGGILQIVSSALHVVKLEGVIGVVGGVKAYRYADAPEGVPALAPA